MDELPGEAELHKFLKAKHLTLIRAKSPMGHVYRVIHELPKNPISTELGTILIKKDEAAAYDKLAGLIRSRIETLIEPIKGDL